MCSTGAHPAPAETDPRACKCSLECLVKPVLSLWEAYNTPAAFWQASLKPFCAIYPPIHLHAEWQRGRHFYSIMRAPFAHKWQLSPPLFSEMHYSMHHCCHSLKIDSPLLPLNITVILQLSAFEIQRQELRVFRRWADIYWNIAFNSECVWAVAFRSKCRWPLVMIPWASDDSTRTDCLPCVRVSLPEWLCNPICPDGVPEWNMSLPTT